MSEKIEVTTMKQGLIVNDIPCAVVYALGKAGRRVEVEWNGSGLAFFVRLRGKKHQAKHQATVVELADRARKSVGEK